MVSGDFFQNVFYSFIGLLLGLIFFYGGFYDLRRKKEIENTPTSKIRSIALGLVEICGSAKPIDKQEIPVSDRDNEISPFTKKKCVYYYMLIEEHKNRGEEGKWTYVDSKMYKNPFYVQDDTGKILIDPKDAKIDIKETFYEQIRPGKKPSAVVLKYMNENNIAYKGLLGFSKRMRFREKAIFVDEQVYVLGTAQSTGQSSSVALENIKIGKKSKWGVFLISNKSEKALLTAYDWKISVSMTIGIMMSIISLGLIMIWITTGA